ncbi:WD40-repeat-containing domain protein [Dipodascopsis uninucleata]
MTSKLLTKIEYKEPVFWTAVHPSKPVVASGLSTGHVYVNKYAMDAESDNESNSGDDSDEDDEIKDAENYTVIKAQKSKSKERLWSTKRHKGSCRVLMFDEKGDYIYSAGTDKVIKQASSDTGRVTAKNTSELESEPTAMAVTASNVLIGTDEATLHIFDPRTMKSEQQYTSLHEDYISSISHLAQYQNTYQLFTTGATSVTRIDIRKGVLSTSDDQEDEIMCSCVVYPSYFEYNSQPGTGLSSDKRIQVTAVMGMASGVLTFWMKDNWEDQQTRANLSEESIDCVAEYPGEMVLAGGADGYVRLLDVKQRNRKLILEHGEDDGVTSISVDAWGRIISSGGETVKVWSPYEMESKPEIESDSSDDSKDSDDSDEDTGKKRKKQRRKRRNGKKKALLNEPVKAKAKPNFSGLD